MKSSTLALAACLLAAPATLHAQQAKASAGSPPMAPQAPLLQRPGQRVEFVVDEQSPGLAGGAFDVPTHHLVVTDLWFSEDIENVMSASNANPAPSQYYAFQIKGRRMTIMPTAAAMARGLPTSIAVRTQSMAVNLAVHVIQKPEDALLLAFVRKRSEVEASEARQAATDDQLGKDGMLRRFLGMRTAPMRPKIVLGDVASQRGRGSDASDITMSNFQASWTGPDEMLLKFELENTGDTDFAWATARAYGQDPEQNHVGAAQAELPPDRANGLVARLPAGRRVWAGILVENARDITGPMTVLLRDKGGRKALAILDHWGAMPMQTEFFVQRFQPVPPPDLEEGKVSLHLQAVYGAAWLGDGTGADLSDATSMTGLGVRAQYAFNRYLAVEGEVMGARTGSARFENITYDGAQGDLARSASLGRAQFGGVLRLGKDTYVPILRLGVGLQGASHDGTLTTATGEKMPGPDVFAVSALFHFGAGLDVRLGNHLVAGFTLTSALLAKSTSPDTAAQISLEAGLHLGYAWTP